MIKANVIESGRQINPIRRETIIVSRLAMVGKITFVWGGSISPKDHDANCQALELEAKAGIWEALYKDIREHLVAINTEIGTMDNKAIFNSIQALIDQLTYKEPVITEVPSADRINPRLNGE